VAGVVCLVKLAVLVTSLEGFFLSRIVGGSGMRLQNFKVEKYLALVVTLLAALYLFEMVK